MMLPAVLPVPGKEFVEPFLWRSGDACQRRKAWRRIANTGAPPEMIYRHRGNGLQGCACRRNGPNFDCVRFSSTGRRPPTIHTGLHPVGDPYGAPTGRGNRSFRLPKSPNEGTRPSDGRSACPGLDGRDRDRAWLTGIPAFVDVVAGVERQSVRRGGNRMGIAGIR